MPIRLRVEFPFDGGVFPPDLGGFVSTTVVEHRAPVLYVAHNHDNSWNFTDAHGDPNEPGALMVVCLWHAINEDPTLGAMASLPLGVEAVRDAPGEPWRSREFDQEEDG